MPTRLVVAALLALAGLAPEAAAQNAAPNTDAGAACRAFTGDLAADREAAAGFCDAVAALAERAATAEARVDDLEDALADVEPWVAPAGAILLVDDVRGCPDGWTDVAETEREIFAGRFPVAAGVGIPDEVPRHRDVGGSHRVQLTERELPSHAHQLPLRFARVPGAEADRAGSGLVTGSARDLVAVPARTGRERTERVGVGAPIENRPPFVGLYFCRRD
jgi:hypothetical protein